MFESFLGEVAGAIVSLIVTAIATYGGFYIKRLDTKLKRKTLLDEINRYVGWVKETDSFKLMNDTEQTTTILEKAKEFAEENEIKISERELKLMVERAVQSLQRLESIGLKLMQKRLSNNKGEE